MNNNEYIFKIGDHVTILMYKDLDYDKGIITNIIYYESGNYYKINCDETPATDGVGKNYTFYDGEFIIDINYYREQKLKELLDI